MDGVDSRKEASQRTFQVAACCFVGSKQRRESYRVVNGSPNDDLPVDSELGTIVFVMVLILLPRVLLPRVVRVPYPPVIHKRELISVYEHGLNEARHRPGANVAHQGNPVQIRRFCAVIVVIIAAVQGCVWTRTDPSQSMLRRRQDDFVHAKDGKAQQAAFEDFCSKEKMNLWAGLRHGKPAGRGGEAMDYLAITLRRRWPIEPPLGD
jgi:hypothetical protein